jgi:hypothetical protein
MSLALFAPVLEGVQELRIHSCQASQVLGVYLICLLLVGIDEPKFAGVGHQYLVATLLSYPAHPGGWVPASTAMRIGGSSEAKRRLRASGVVRSLPSSITSPLCWSMRQRGRSTCRRGPIRLSCLVAVCYHPLWADPPSILGVRARRTVADPKGTAYLGGRPSHLIFLELCKVEVQLRRIPLPRTRVNKDIRKGRGCFEPRPSATFADHYFFCTLVVLTSP